MYCPYCGKPVDPGIAYCPWCGGGLREDTSSPIPDNLLETAEHAALDPEQVQTPAAQEIPVIRPERAGAPKRTARPTPRSDRGSARGAASSTPDNSGVGRLLGGLLIAALAIGLVYLVWTQGCSRLSPAPVAPAPAPQQEEAAEQPTETTQEPAEEQQEEPEEEPQPTDGVKASLAEYTWDELSAISAKISAAPDRAAALEVARTYNLVDEAGVPTGDTISIQLSDGSTLKVFLADVYHDDLVGGGKAGLTFLAWNLPLAHRMNADASNAGGWESSEMRSWVVNSALGMLPTDLRTAIRPVLKMTNNTGNTHDAASVTATEDTLWIPSVTEVAGDVDWVWSSDAGNSGGYNAVLNAEGDQYAIFAGAVTNTDGPNAALVLKGDGQSSWWLRSSSASVTSNYRYVTAEGNPCGFGGATTERGVCLGFCL